MTDDIDRARWEGSIEARLSDAERRLDAINGSIKAHAEATNNLAVTVGGLVTRVGVYATLGSVAGGAIVSAAVALLLR